MEIWRDSTERWRRIWNRGEDACEVTKQRGNEVTKRREGEATERREGEVTRQRGNEVTIKAEEIKAEDEWFRFGKLVNRMTHPPRFLRKC